MKLITHPHPLLQQVARQVSDDELADVKSSIDQMLDIMYTGEGVGLAAPQVADLRRFILVDHSNGEDVKALRVMVNPVMHVQTTGGSATDVAEEGCLSFPGRRIKVKRYSSIVVEYLDAMTGQHVLTNITGFEARIIQHEIDHLDGITLLDRSRF